MAHFFQHYAFDVSDPDNTAIEISNTVLRWQTIPWFPLILALALPMCFAGQSVCRASLTMAPLPVFELQSSSAGSTSASTDRDESGPSEAGVSSFDWGLLVDSQKSHSSSGSTSSPGSSTSGAPVCLASSPVIHESEVGCWLVNNSFLMIPEPPGSRRLRPPQGHYNLCS